MFTIEINPWRPEVARSSLFSSKPAGALARASAAISDSWDAVIGRQADPNEDVNAIAATRQIGQPADLADLLPPEAAARLRAWREQREDLQAAYHGLGDEWHALHLEKQKAANRVAILSDPLAASAGGYGYTVPADHPSVIDARQKLARLTTDLERLTERRDARGHRGGELGRMIEISERYLAANAFAPFSLVPVKSKGTLDAARKEIARLRADLQEINAAPIPSKQVKAAMRAEIDRLADRGRPDMFGAVEHGNGIGWPKLTQTVQTQFMTVFTPGQDGSGQVRGRATSEGPDTLSLMAWLHKDALLAALDREVDEMADDAAALSDEERAAKIAKTKAALLIAERNEVALIDESGEITYRPDTDPRALLGIDGPEPREA